MIDGMMQNIQLASQLEAMGRPEEAARARQAAEEPARQFASIVASTTSAATGKNITDQDVANMLMGHGTKSTVDLTQQWQSRRKQEEELPLERRKVAVQEQRADTATTKSGETIDKKQIISDIKDTMQNIRTVLGKEPSGMRSYMSSIGNPTDADAYRGMLSRQLPMLNRIRIKVIKNLPLRDEEYQYINKVTDVESITPDNNPIDVLLGALNNAEVNVPNATTTNQPQLQSAGAVVQAPPQQATISEDAIQSIMNTMRAKYGITDPIQLRNLAIEYLSQK
jgi:hypothetical protein